jgi:hypothetical protein
MRHDRGQVVTVCGGADSSCFLQGLGDQQVNELSLRAVTISRDQVISSVDLRSGR